MAKTYRDYSNDIVSYQAEMRDNYVALNGIVVEAEIPNIENNTDLYSDFDPTAVTRVAIPVIPLFDKYYQLLNVVGDDQEEKVPLEVFVRVCDYVPQNTVIPLDSRTHDGQTRIRRWRVLTTEIKHIENFYAKVAHCVPERSAVADSGDM